jgi:hypothetical protein
VIRDYADNGEAFLADKNLNPESGEAIIRNSPIEYYLVPGKMLQQI